MNQKLSKKVANKVRWLCSVMLQPFKQDMLFPLMFSDTLEIKGKRFTFKQK